MCASESNHARKTNKLTAPWSIAIFAPGKTAMSLKYSPKESSNDPVQTGPVLLGVDLSRHHIRLGAVSSGGKLLTFRRELYPESNEPDPRRLADFIISTIRQMIDEHGASSPVTSIGVAFPGMVNQHTRQVLLLPKSADLSGLDIYNEIESAFRLPLRFDMNANASAYAEMRSGIARGVSNWLYLHIGANVGAGLVLGGKLQRGKSGLAGAIGQMLIDPERIGENVTLESMVSADNIVRRTRDRLKRDNTSSLSRLGAMGGFSYDDIISAAHLGDDLAKMMMQRTGTFISMALAGIISLLDLEMIAVGGAPAGRPFLVPAIAEGVRQLAFAQAYEDCRIVEAEMGAEAAVIGAALLAAPDA